MFGNVTSHHTEQHITPSSREAPTDVPAAVDLTRQVLYQDGNSSEEALYQGQEYSVICVVRGVLLVLPHSGSDHSQFDMLGGSR